MEKMSIKDFWKSNNLGKNLNVMKSSSKKYEDSDIPVLYINLSHEVDGQDYIVLSKTLAEQVVNGESILDGQAIKDDDFGWGFVAKAKVFKTFSIE